MPSTRREFLRGAVAWGALLAGGSFKLAASREHPSLRAAVEFLAAHQSPDGAWRSEQCAAFRDGDALTPVVVWALQTAPAGDRAGAVLAGAYRWLEQLTDRLAASDSPWNELRYPLFTASYAVRIFAQAGDAPRASQWANRLAALRLQTALGWPVDSPELGAWSDSPTPPHYTVPEPDMLEANLSATRLAVEGLGAAGRSAEARGAVTFIAACQNFAEPGPFTKFDDGGFFFALHDSIRNKAGSPGRDASGHLRFRSYGSATCDGLLALMASGLPLGHPRCRAASAWMRRHGHGLDHPGEWTPERAASRESLVYYHAQARAAVLQRLRIHQAWAEDQSRELSRGLIAAQRPDGSWQGTAPQSGEDDPLLATAFALRALADVG